MGVHERTQSGITVIDVDGEFYGDNATDDLEAAIQRDLADGSLQLILNLSECAMMNSDSLRVMIKAKKAYEARGGRITICGARRKIKHLLQVVGLYDWFDRYDDEVEAVQSFSGRRAG